MARKSTRDTQRTKLYRAEGPFIREYGKSVPEVADMEAFVARVWASRRVQKAFPKATRGSPPIVKDGRGRRRAGGCGWMITMPQWSRDTATVLHELAHSVTDREYGLRNIPAHGWQFCDTYLKLALYLMGREAHDVLKASFKEHRVRFRPKRTRTLTPEAREQLRERAAIARAARNKPKKQESSNVIDISEHLRLRRPNR